MIPFHPSSGMYTEHQICFYRILHYASYNSPNDAGAVKLESWVGCSKYQFGLISTIAFLV